MMAASCGEIVREFYGYLFHFFSSEASGRLFCTRSYGSDQATHAKLHIWSSRRLATFCTDDLQEGWFNRVLLRVWYDRDARGSSPHPICRIHADLLMD